MLMKHQISGLAAVVSLISGAIADPTRVDDAQMTKWLKEDGVALAHAYAPMWFFGQAMKKPPCIPTWAFSGSPTSPDIYDAGHQTKAGGLCDWPNVGCHCRNPGVAPGNKAPAFPVYYSFKKCNGGEVRVAYNLFYEKDGVVGAGHGFDWERVIVVHKKDSSNKWGPSDLFLSQHSGYSRKAWGKIQNTLTTQEVNDGKAKEPNGVKNNDHPKVYVSWSKHANFDDRNTGFNDILSQSTKNAFRSQDWWYFVDQKYYIRADDSTPAGAATLNMKWGSASSNPHKVYDDLCKI